MQYDNIFYVCHFIVNNKFKRLEKFLNKLWEEDMELVHTMVIKNPYFSKSFDRIAFTSKIIKPRNPNNSLSLLTNTHIYTLVRSGIYECEKIMEINNGLLKGSNNCFGLDMKKPSIISQKII